MFAASALLSFILLATSRAQQIGTFTPEVHPPLPFHTCTTAAGCTTQQGSVVLDANWRWTHTANATTCNPNGFSTAICPDATTCAENCAVEGADYAGTYGVTTATAVNGVTLAFGSGGSRLYLLDETDNYAIFKTLNQEFSFDVDVSLLPCGLNGAIYFSEMPANGGKGPLNAAGAAYGTGYCDSQCPKGINFMNGTANPTGAIGSCCNEFDLWEANSMATALTPHPCALNGPFACQGSQCSDLCDPDGCDLNPFRLGAQDFYGPGLTVDTTKPFTVVTQFRTNDGTATGNLAEIRRLYVQNGVVIQNAAFATPGIPAGNSITQNFCNLKEATFSDPTYFNTYGGMQQMGESLARGVVLVLSIWNDLTSGMLWLDGVFPQNSTAPGTFRGPCSPTSGDVSDPSAAVTVSNVKIGDIGSTFAVPECAAGGLPVDSQCGGLFYEGALACDCPSKCTFVNEWYSQCL